MQIVMQTVFILISRTPALSVVGMDLLLRRPTISEECVDDVLGGPWGSDGTFNCDTNANSDQNCLHDESKNAC